jgi:two-component system alkaline phosphatase synthesis response regulator PhoP
MDERLLVIEDEEALRMTLTDRLASEGYQVECATDGQEGLDLATNGAYDAILLDVMLPRKNGLDVCREVRQHGLITPILILTARGQTVDKVVGLKLGADDYVTKPFEMAELVARIEALLRRGAVSRPPSAAVHHIGSLVIDLRGTTVTKGGKQILLSAREFQLLRYLIENRGATLSRDQILKDVWDYSAKTFTRTVDVHIAGLRQKIENDAKHPELILTVPGLGYKFAE